LRSLRVRPCADLRDAARSPDGDRARIAGVVLVRQRPGTAKDVTFMTIEDETGAANLVVWSRVYKRYRAHARATMLIATGRIQRQGEVVHLVVQHLHRLDATEQPNVRSRDFR
ncbi:MAG: hypothetical protein K2Q09_05940, partial [Phycisphaerales bacterium]|nr:hypothetical protein [Phycisphaerales bacterium]